MWFSRLFKRRKSEEAEKKPTVTQGIFYLYLIIGLQVLFVFALMAIIITIGKLLATPLWVFLFTFLVGVGGCMYIYRKAKSQFRRFKETLQRVDLSDRNYEISLMGGVLTMRVEHHPRTLLEDHSAPVLEAETVKAQPGSGLAG